METTHSSLNVTSSKEAMTLEERYGAHNYHPLPVTLSRGEGVFVWDVEGKRYYDFLSSYSAVNQGHCHPHIINTLIEQAKTLTLTSRAFYNDKLGLAEQYVCELFLYDKAIFMNSGAEAVETAIKLARKWGYLNKGIETNKASIIVAEGNFHGRTTTIISASTDSTARTDFGPYTPGFTVIPYDDITALANTLEHHPEVCAFLIEPIQGEAGVYVPSEGYLSKAKDLCAQYNVLLVVDEIQTGVARTGKMLASDYEQLHADMLILGKAISGGTIPVSCVLSSNEVMDTLKPGEHGSTYGGNPLASAVCMKALEVVQEEDMATRAYHLGNIFRQRMEDVIQQCDIAKLVRGKGLLNAVVINDTAASEAAWNICMNLKDKGILAKPTHGNIIRFAPPLVINEEQLDECCDIISDVLRNS